VFLDRDSKGVIKLYFHCILLLNKFYFNKGIGITRKYNLGRSMLRYSLFYNKLYPRKSSF